MGLPPTLAESPFADGSAAVQTAVAAFEDAWLAGRPPCIDDHLGALVGAARDRALRELVHIDMERRLGAGETVRVEHYLGRYPELAAETDHLLGLIQWEFRLRRAHDPDLGRDDYHARFPALGAELELWLNRAGLDGPALATPGVPPMRQVAGAIPGYRVLAEIGRGGMGVVYKARHTDTDRVVALKVVRRELTAQPSARRRFAREILATARLDHPHIVRVLDAAETGDTCFLAMEYLEGDTLHQVVERDGRRAVWEACELTRQAALGLDHAHAAGLVHRDVKPSNLIRLDPTADAPAGTVKLLDLGLVRIDAEDDTPLSTLTQPGVLMGTIDFIAPEQAVNPHLADARADLYSLGCSLYYLLLGRVPFPVGSLMEKLDKHRWVTPRPVDKLRTEVPRRVAEVVERLLAKDPGERFRTAAEAADALAPFCTPAGCAAARAAQAVRLTPTSPSIVIRPTPREPRPVGALRRLTGHTDAVCALAVTPDGAQVISASRDQSLRVWDVSGRIPVRPLSGHTWYGHACEVRCTAVSADGRHVLSGGSDRNVRLWDLTTGRLLTTLAGHTDAVKAVAFSPDGRQALSAGNDRRLILWDVPGGRKVQTLKGHTGDPNCVAFAPGGALAVSGGWDKTLRVWDLATGKERRCLGGPYSDFQWSVFMGLAFHPDGRLVVASSDHTVYLLDAETGRVSQRFAGHTNWVSSVAVSPDGGHVLSGSWDGTVRLWSVAQGRQAGCFEGHTDQVQTVAFAPDGLHAFSAGADRTVIHWRLFP